MPIIAAYSCDEAGNTVIDYANNNDFSIASTGVIRNASGHTNGGLSSNGTDKVILSDLGQTANRTLMAWIKDIEAITDQWIMEWHVTSIDSGAWGFLSLSGQIHVQARNAGGFARASHALPSDNAWHHYTATYDGTNIKLYIDASLQATTALTAPLRTDATPLLGGWTASGPILDDIRIYDEALDATAITAAMNTPVTDLPGAKVWNGSSWISATTKTYNGSSWVNAAPPRVL